MIKPHKYGFVVQRLSLECKIPIDSDYKLSWLEFNRLHPVHEVLFSFGKGEVERCPEVVKILKEIPTSLESNPVDWYSELVGLADGFDFCVVRRPNGLLWKIYIFEGNGGPEALIFNADKHFLLRDLDDDSALPCHYGPPTHAIKKSIDWSGVQSKYESEIKAWLLAN